MKYLLLSLLSISVYAESVIELEMMRPVDTIRTIINAEFVEFDSIRLDMPIQESGDHHFQLICSFNPLYDFDKSYLFLTNSTPSRGQKFEINDHDCLDFFNFMKSRFEYISEENPIEIKLDYENRKVEKVRWKTKVYENENELNLT